jgi:dCMP deaminase
MNKDKIKEYLKLATREAEKSGCLRAKIGCVLVGGERVLVKSHNEIFPADQYCQEKGCLRDKLKLGLGQYAERCRAIHAEAKAVAQAAKKGVSLDGAVVYVTCCPCINCAKILVKAGIKEVYFLDQHGDSGGRKILEISGVKVERIALEGDDPATRLRDTSGQGCEL